MKPNNLRDSENIYYAVDDNKTPQIHQSISAKDYDKMTNLVSNDLQGHIQILKNHYSK